MQAPGDAARAERDAGAGADAQAAPRLFGQLTMGPRAWCCFLHNQSGAVITGAFVVAGIGQPDVAGQRLENPIVVPGVLSFLAYGTMTALGLEIVRPKIYRRLLARPWAWPLALLALAGL